MRTRLILSFAALFGVGLSATAESTSHFAPRREIEKTQTKSLVVPRDESGRSTWNGRLIVKFKDQVRARVRPDGRGFNSLSAKKLSSADQILAKYNLTVKPVFSNRSEQQIELVRTRARDNSFREQPDFAGILYVLGNERSLERAARELNDLDIVEYVQFEQEYVYHQCGDTATHDCVTVDMAPFCTDEICCELVGNIYPVCVDPNGSGWDQFCVELAHVFCQGDAYDRCLAPKTNGGCFEAHPTPGCKNETCCNAVCDVIPFCCNVIWDQSCVNAACSLCGVAGGSAPDFTEDNPANFHQKYRTPEPVGAGSVFFDSTGFNGRGLNLPALHNFADLLINDYGLETENLTFGKTIKVGVVEHSAHVNHEDLINKVIPEPGQTIVEIEQGILSPNHGTATLGEIVAENNGFGVTGIAWEAQGYFFPIVSLEEGGRIQNAIFSALSAFGPGDVLNFSIGPGGGGTLVSAQTEWLLIRAGSDLGITSCISAGNSCTNLDQFPQFAGDSGAIIVGAGWSGGPFDVLAGDPPPPIGAAFCRLGFSNYCQQCSTESNVHVQAWGHNVCTTGYGDLSGQCGVDPNRTYTAEFNGTSAAAPIIAGAVANLQGLAKMIYGIPLTPEQVRDNVLTLNGRPQCETPQPPGNDINPCAGDFSFATQPNRIGPFPDLAEASVGVLVGAFFDGGNAGKVTIHTGTKIVGNQFSVRFDDNKYLQVASKKARVGNRIAGLVYLATGNTTDIEVEFDVLTQPQDATVLGVRSIGFSTAPLAIQALYAFNYNKSRWQLLGIEPVQSGEDPDGGFVLESELFFPVDVPFNYIKGGKVRVRVYTVGIGAGGPMEVFHELVDLDIQTTNGPVDLPDP